MVRIGCFLILSAWVTLACIGDDRVPGELVVTRTIKAPTEPLTFVSDLGPGHPQTAAPLFETLVTLKQDSKFALIDQHHATPPAAQSLAVSTSPSAPLQNYRREYAGMVCDNGVCQATYRMVPVSVQTAAPVAYDSIGGGVAIQGSGYGCAGVSSGCSGAAAGCSGSAAGCSGQRFGIFRNRSRFILPWRRR